MPELTRRSVLLGALASPTLAYAQTNWPSGVITLVAPAPAGGSLDIIARLVQPGLQQRLGTTVIVENRSGGGTSLGAAYVAKAQRDGTKWLINADPQILTPSLLPNLPYDPTELDPILLLGTSPNVLAAYPGAPYKNFEDMLTAARKGDGINLAVLIDTLGHISMVLWSKLAQAKLSPITYRSAPQAINDAIAGHIPLISGSASVLAPYLESGKLRAIVQTGMVRLPALGDVPTLNESGFPGFDATSFWGFYAPSRTPDAIVDRFVAELTATIEQPENRTKLTETFLLDLKIAGRSEFRTYFAERLAKWGQVIREHNLGHAN